MTPSSPIPSKTASSSRRIADLVLVSRFAVWAVASSITFTSSWRARASRCGLLAERYLPPHPAGALTVTTGVFRLALRLGNEGPSPSGSSYCSKRHHKGQDTRTGLPPGVSHAGDISWPRW